MFMLTLTTCPWWLPSTQSVIQMFIFILCQLQSLFFDWKYFSLGLKDWVVYTCILNSKLPVSEIPKLTSYKKKNCWIQKFHLHADKTVLFILLIGINQRERKIKGSVFIDITFTSRATKEDRGVWTLKQGQFTACTVLNDVQVVLNTKEIIHEKGNLFNQFNL